MNKTWNIWNKSNKSEIVLVWRWFGGVLFGSLPDLVQLDATFWKRTVAPFVQTLDGAGQVRQVRQVREVSIVKCP